MFRQVWPRKCTLCAVPSDLKHKDGSFANFNRFIVLTSRSVAQNSRSGDFRADNDNGVTCLSLAHVRGVMNQCWLRSIFTNKPPQLMNSSYLLLLGSCNSEHAELLLVSQKPVSYRLVQQSLQHMHVHHGSHHHQLHIQYRTFQKWHSKSIMSHEYTQSTELRKSSDSFPYRVNLGNFGVWRLDQTSISVAQHCMDSTDTFTQFKG